MTTACHISPPPAIGNRLEKEWHPEFVDGFFDVVERFSYVAIARNNGRDGGDSGGVSGLFQTKYLDLGWFGL